jgi:hypothetical protein
MPRPAFIRAGILVPEFSELIGTRFLVPVHLFFREAQSNLVRLVRKDGVGRQISLNGSKWIMKKRQ